MIPPNTNSPTRRPARGLRAFSLIEVTIALGILSSGILLLIGLMPTGVQTLNDAAKKSMGRRIAQNIISEMLLHEWKELHKFNSTIAGIRYFDEYGIELDANSASDRADSVFRVRVRVVGRDVILDHSSPLPPVSRYWLPNDPGGGALPRGTVKNLRRIHIDLTSAPVFTTPAEFGPTDPNTNAGDVTDPRVKTYTSIISNMVDVDTIINNP